MAAPYVDELFERGRELDELAARIERAAAGQGGLIVIEGPAGIGKSRLLGAARGARPSGAMRVLTARGSELEGEFAFGVVRQLFEAELRGAGPAAGAARGRRGAGARRCSASPTPATGGGTPRSPRCTGSSGSCSTSPEERPLLLAVDDLHWCDRPSLRFVAYLARRLEGQPVAARGDAARAGGRHRRGAARRARQRPGGDQRAARPAEPRGRGGVRRASGSAPRRPRRSAAACHDATGGNPLLLSQLLTALRRPRACRPTPRHAGLVRDIGPRAVSRTVLLRLARLPTGARAVAQAVAVLGDGAGLPAVAALAGVGEADGRGRHAPRWRRPRSCARSARSASSTRSCATPSTTTCRPASARSSTPAPRRSCGTLARRSSRSPPSCCTRRRAARPGSPSSCGRRAARRCARAPSTAPSRTCGAPSTTSRRRRAAAACCSSWARRRRSPTARPRRSTWRSRTRSSTTPRRAPTPPVCWGGR